jgi:hypothetical protein
VMSFRIASASSGGNWRASPDLLRFGEGSITCGGGLLFERSPWVRWRLLTLRPISLGASEQLRLWWDRHCLYFSPFPRVREAPPLSEGRDWLTRIGQLAKANSGPLWEGRDWLTRIGQLAGSQFWPSQRGKASLFPIAVSEIWYCIFTMKPFDAL